MSIVNNALDDCNSQANSGHRMIRGFDDDRTLLEEFRSRHRCTIAPPRAPSLRPNDSRLVNALQLSDLVPEVDQQLALVFELLSTDFTLDATSRAETTTFSGVGLTRGHDKSLPFRCLGETAAVLHNSGNRGSKVWYLHGRPALLSLSTNSWCATKKPLCYEQQNLPSFCFSPPGTPSLAASSSPPTPGGWIGRQYSSRSQPSDPWSSARWPTAGVALRKQQRHTTFVVSAQSRGHRQQQSSTGVRGR